MIISNRIPVEYFLTTGKGESDAGSKGLPFETGSYDSALNYAGIENANIIKYTSVIPTDAKKVQKENALKKIQWGQVMECIMAQNNGKTGEKIAAAVVITNVTDPDGKHLGGFACEYSGSEDIEQIKKSLMASIRGMILRRNMGDIGEEAKWGEDNKTEKGFVIHPGKEFIHEEMKVEKSAGTVFASICFMSFKVIQDFSVLSKESKGGKKKKSVKKYRYKKRKSQKRH